MLVDPNCNDVAAPLNVPPPPPPLLYRSIRLASILSKLVSILENFVKILLFVEDSPVKYKSELWIGTEVLRTFAFVTDSILS